MHKSDTARRHTIGHRPNGRRQRRGGDILRCTACTAKSMQCGEGCLPSGNPRAIGQCFWFRFVPGVMYCRQSCKHLFPVSNSAVYADCAALASTLLLGKHFDSLVDLAGSHSRLRAFSPPGNVQSKDFAAVDPGIASCSIARLVAHVGGQSPVVTPAGSGDDEIVVLAGQI